MFRKAKRRPEERRGGQESCAGAPAGDEGEESEFTSGDGENQNTTGLNQTPPAKPRPTAQHTRLKPSPPPETARRCFAKRNEAALSTAESDKRSAEGTRELRERSANSLRATRKTKTQTVCSQAPPETAHRCFAKRN